jgi:hypothetical protein
MTNIKEEFELSERRQDEYGDYCYKQEDVKEFIRLLKENVAKVENAVWMHELNIFYAEIDKLAGEKLCQ